MAGVAARSQSTKTESEKRIIQPSNLRATGWTLCTCKRWSTSAQQDDRGLIDWSSQTVGFPDPGGCIIIQVWLCEIRAYALLLFLENEKHQNSPLQHKPRWFVCVSACVGFLCLLVAPLHTCGSLRCVCLCVARVCTYRWRAWLHPTALLAALQAYAQRDWLVGFGEKGENWAKAQVAPSGTSQVVNKASSIQPSDLWKN